MHGDNLVANFGTTSIFLDSKEYEFLRILSFYMNENFKMNEIKLDLSYICFYCSFEAV